MNEHHPAGPRRTGTVQIEAGDPPALRHAVDLSPADDWQVLLTLDGVPVSCFRLPSPGRCEDGVVVDAAVVVYADELAAYLNAGDELAARMGEPVREYPPRTCTVAICTHRRRDQLARALAAVGRLDPRPDDVLVVDNAPGDQDCREIAAAAGARYLRVERQGLNRSRAAAVAACDTDLIAFTDDDCEPPPGWLARLPELFADRTVAAVTGPAFAAQLDAASARTFESSASFSRGLREQRFDWLSMSPIHATRAGAGANMVIRRAVAQRLDPMFPPELDAGTPTESGGDMYALYRVLADGLRVVYDPGTFTFHHHRGETESLHRALRGYGTGLMAVSTKVLIEHRELSGARIATWLLGNYLRTVARGLTGHARPHEVRVAWDYLRGGLAGPFAWLASRRSSPPERSGKRLAPGSAEPPPAIAEIPQAAEPVISVIIPTIGRRASLARCRAALAGQEGAPPFELLVMDGSEGAAAARNAGAEAARGEILLFLDDDLIAEPDLLRRHAEAHAGGGAGMVVGYSPPRPAKRTLAARSAALWWEDHFRRLGNALSHTFVDVLSGNMSVRREVFDRVGEFDRDFVRREDWEWGLRALEAGVEMTYVPEAVARHEFSLDARGRLAAARLEGKGDALLVRRRPETIPSLTLYHHGPLGGSRYRLAVEAMRSERVREAVVRVLNVMERAGARTTWAAWFGLVQRAAYQHGLRDGAVPAGLARRRMPVKRVELLRHDPVEPPGAVAPLVELSVGGRTAARIVPRDGQWNANVARDVVNQSHPESLPRARPARIVPGGVQVLGPLRKNRRGWAAVDEAIRSARGPIVAVPLSGSVAPAAIREGASTALAGDRIAIALGGIGATERNLALIDLEFTSGSFPMIGRPPGWMAVRRDAYVRAGGLDASLAQLGSLAPLLDLVDRVLREDWVVGYVREGTRGPQRLRRGIQEWRRWQARGTLMTVRGGPDVFRRGFVPRLARVWRAGLRRQGGFRGAVGTTLAFTVGWLRGLLLRRHPTATAESARWWSSSESIPAPPTPATEWSSHAAASSRRSTAG